MNLLQLNDRGEHRRRSAAKRRTLLAIALASATLVAGGVTALATTGGIGGTNTQQVDSASPQALDDVPPDEPRKGMVYKGLEAAPEDSSCVGGFEVEGVKQCTHGPDSPPKGVDITKDTPPAVKAAVVSSIPEAGAGKAPGGAELLSDVPATLDAAHPGKAIASAPPASTGTTGTAAKSAAAQDAASAVICDGDGSTGNRVQVVYAHGPGANRFAEYLPSFKKWAHDSDVIYNASATETGGVRHIRYVTESDCTVAVLNLEVPASAMQDFSATNQALAAQGLNRRDRKYMIFADSNVYCGIGSFAGDERPGPENSSNFGPSYGRTDSGCWGGSTPAHELGHNLGAVNNSAPHTSRGGHCVDEWDIMCYSDTPYYPQMQIHCPNRSSDDRLDCNHDDYFNTNPQPGSYLTTHWNIANNQFLLSNGGSNPNPNPTPSPTPSPTKTAGPTPNPTTTTPNPNPTTGPDVVVSQVTQNSAVLTWKPATGATGYDLLLDQRAIGNVKATTVRVVSLKPGTQYKVAVAVHGADGKVSAPGRQAAFRTQPAGGTTAGPVEPGKRYLMLNSFTGQAADMYGSSRANGAVLIGYQRHGYTNQQWLFESVGGGYVRVKSAVSGKCLQIGGKPVAGQWIAQQPCGTAASQAWKITANATGYTLGVKGSPLVLGVSNRDYYGGALLELQQPGNQAWQRWTFQQSTS
ncbi:RICIN domain-containing protein [Streptomyces sp. RKAG293]|uniref:RICIN domain-containing protein n=1 Tax=Streptomyces sp. RKAG293 TaxID=2893403 RepID=UPI002034A616|nr:RICIN domain-containing protein [Streptomyces sp. RKAG293]MCM2417093.1 RICIN domain-containing protein [Streptomyces sp. RKAG293]